MTVMVDSFHELIDEQQFVAFRVVFNSSNGSSSQCCSCTGNRDSDSVVVTVADFHAVVETAVVPEVVLIV